MSASERALEKADRKHMIDLISRLVGVVEYLGKQPRPKTDEDFKLQLQFKATYDQAKAFLEEQEEET